MRKISVIIPCYNVAPYIDRCIASIAAQTFGMDNLEIICVDDASTDDTWEHLQIWEQRYPYNVLLIRQKVNGRQGAARNIGLQYASAGWIAWVDADDWLEPDYFEKLYKPTEQYVCDVVCSDWVRDSSVSLTYFDEGVKYAANREEKYIMADTRELTKEVIVTAFLGRGVCGKIVRKSLLVDTQIMFPEGVAYEDEYWLPLLSIYAKGIYMISERLYHYFINPNSTVLSRNEEYHMDLFKVQMMKWTDYAERGLLQEYSEELEYSLMRNAADVVRMLIFQYDRPEFSFFEMEREFMKSYVPDYERNRYIAILPGYFRLFLKVLYSSVDEAGFLQIAEEIKKNWNGIV